MCGQVVADATAKADSPLGHVDAANSARQDLVQRPSVSIGKKTHLEDPVWPLFFFALSRIQMFVHCIKLLVWGTCFVVA